MMVVEEPRSPFESLRTNGSVGPGRPWGVVPGLRAGRNGVGGWTWAGGRGGLEGVGPRLRAERNGVGGWV